MDSILNIGIILAFFLGILLFNKKNKSLTDKILAFWLMVISIHLLGYYISNQGYWEKYPHLIGITAPFPLLHGPLLFLYVSYSFKNLKRLRKVDYLHFLPVILAYLYLSPFFFGYSAEEKTLVDKGLIDDFSIFINVLMAGFILSGFTYVLLSYQKLIQRKKILSDNFSTDDYINLAWLRYSILSIAAVFITAAIIIILRELLQFNFTFNADLIFYSFVVVFVIYIGYFGIRQQGLFTDNISESLVLQPDTEKGYKKSGLKVETALTKHKELLTLMETDKPYLNPKLSLNELALKLSLSTNYLSQVINHYEQVNFYDFVNRYRVEEFIVRAQTNNNYSLLAHALDSGFNSKSSFNTVFKKFKQTTPRQYLDTYNPNNL